MTREEFLAKNYLGKTIDEILGNKAEDVVEEHESTHYALISQIKFDDIKNIDSYMGVTVEETETEFNVEYAVFHGKKLDSENKLYLLKDDKKMDSDEWNDWMEALKDTIVCLWGQSELLQAVLSRYHAIVNVKFIDVKLASGKSYGSLSAKETAEELYAMWQYKIERQERIEKDLKDIIWKQEETEEKEEK